MPDFNAFIGGQPPEQAAGLADTEATWGIVKAIYRESRRDHHE
jgi:hypothetical protein